jgi:ribonuclease HI
VKKGFETWMLNWLTNGWLNFHGDPVENKPVWQKLLREQKGIELNWVI